MHDLSYLMNVPYCVQNQGLRERHERERKKEGEKEKERERQKERAIMNGRLDNR